MTAHEHASLGRLHAAVQHLHPIAYSARADAVGVSGLVLGPRHPVQRRDGVDDTELRRVPRVDTQDLLHA